MKRFVVLFTSLVLSIPMIGCGGAGGTGSSADDPSKWGEAKKHQAKVAAEEAARIEKLQKKNR